LNQFLDVEERLLHGNLKKANNSLVWTQKAAPHSSSVLQARRVRGNCNPPRFSACWVLLKQHGHIMNDDARLAKAHEDIREAGYQFAAILYDELCGNPEVDHTKDNIHECIYESAHHDLEDALESVGRERFKYLDWLDWEIAMESFSEGIHRLIEEKYRDT
jgi:hypothetical protein